MQDSLAGFRGGKPFRLQMILGPDSEPIGYFHASGDTPDKGSLFVGMFLIRPDCAGQGLGRAAAAGLLRHAAVGHRRVLLKVYLGNVDALGFWVKCGFKTVHAFRPAKGKEPASLILEQSAAR